ncbi:MAG: hypothetical protein WD055_00990 [Candidatus Dependentiae bacterium]
MKKLIQLKKMKRKLFFCSLLLALLPAQSFVDQAMIKDLLMQHGKHTYAALIVVDNNRTQRFELRSGIKQNKNTAYRKAIVNDEPKTQQTKKTTIPKKLISIGKDDLLNPQQLQQKINSADKEQKQKILRDMIKEIAKYTNSWFGKQGIKSAIKKHPQTARIITELAKEHIIQLAQTSQQAPLVLKELLKHKTIAQPIKQCIVAHAQQLQNTTYGPAIVTICAQA